MIITWRGQSFFELAIKNQEHKEVKVVIDPYDESLGLKVPKVEAQILLVSHSHSDHSNLSAIIGEPFLIKTPGEYEIQGVFIKGIPAFHNNNLGKEKEMVTIYKIEAEEMKICHLSDLGQKELTKQQLEEIGAVDILMIPVGGIYTIGAKEASSIISQIEPKLVVPMHYQIPKLKVKLEGVEKFLKVMGVGSIEPEAQLKIKLIDLPKEEETKIVILKAR